YGARAGLNTLLVEEIAPGGQALLIDGLENYPALVGPVSGYDFSEAMRSQAESFGVTFLTASVSSLARDTGRFVLQTDEGSVRALAVVLATGAKHRHLDVPGEERLTGRGVSYCATCDGPFFKGKRMVVVGGGDAACDEAMFLSKLAERVIMVHRKDRFRAQRSLAERVLKNPKIEVRFDTVVREIRGDKKVESVVMQREGEEPYEEPTAAVFVFVGSIPQTQLAEEARKGDGGSLVTDERMQTTVPGLFAAGDVRVTPFRQLVTAAADGATAAHSAAQFIDEIRGESYA
ncbi:MAG TPA: FAD-dependent oxidoreductase, partial [Rectinemataceae bacterium]|nr:FAD-dependent oxidoreductase [Rectinemataceae bacterium]